MTRLILVATCQGRRREETNGPLYSLLSTMERRENRERGRSEKSGKVLTNGMKNVRTDIVQNSSDNKNNKKAKTGSTVN